MSSTDSGIIVFIDSGLLCHIIEQLDTPIYVEPSWIKGWEGVLRFESAHQSTQ